MDEPTEARAELRAAMQELLDLLHRPAQKRIGDLAQLVPEDGRRLSKQTISGLLNDQTRAPRWDTVWPFVQACGLYATKRRQSLPPELLDKKRWERLCSRAQTEAKGESRQIDYTNYTVKISNSQVTTFGDIGNNNNLVFNFGDSDDPWV